MTTVIVEGHSDRVALEVIASRLGQPSPRIVVLGGAHGARRAVAQLSAERVVGLVDLKERPLLAGIVDRLYVCDPDLEGEMIRAVGAAEVERLIEDQGELASFRRLQRQPAQRTRSVEAQLARFFAGRSGNKERYARVLAEAVPLDRVPPPLRDLLREAGGDERGSSAAPAPRSPNDRLGDE